MKKQFEKITFVGQINIFEKKVLVFNLLFICLYCIEIIEFFCKHKQQVGVEWSKDYYWLYYAKTSLRIVKKILDARQLIFYSFTHGAKTIAFSKV